MNSMIWGLLALKGFFLCWLIYYLLERRKKRVPQQSLATTEQGMITTYAGAPVTQIPVDYNAYYQPHLTSANTKPPNSQASPILINQPNMMAKS